MSLGWKTFCTMKESLEGPQFREIEESLKGMKVGGTDEHAFGYLYDEIIPTVYVGLKELSKEVEYYQQNEKVNEEIKERFNPLIYLAQFIMRNHPKYQTNPEIQMVQKVIKQQRIIRNLKEVNYDKLLQDVQKHLNTDKDKFAHAHVIQIADYLDTQMDQNKELLTYIQKNKDVIKIRASGNKIHLQKIFDIVSEFGHEHDEFDINSLKKLNINFTL